MYKKSSNPLVNMTDKELADIADRIVYLRNEIFHMSQSQFAAVIDISQTYLSLIENKKNSITLDVISRISSNLQIKTDWILYGDGDPNMDSDLKSHSMSENLKATALSGLCEAYSLSEKDSDFIKWYASLSPRKRLSLIDTIQAIKNL